MKVTKLKVLPIALIAGAFAHSAMADRTYSFPAIYPFVPKATQDIYKTVKRVTEDKEFIKSFNEIVFMGLSKGKTAQKPWTASYWPMNKGMIADPYEDNPLPYYLDIGWVDWEDNYDDFKKRLKKELPDVDKMSQEELDMLAPSEKYDLLLGDKNFSLTRKLWNYTYKWGSNKENSFTDMDTLQSYIAGEQALVKAKQYVKDNYYKNVKDALAGSWLLKGSLAAQKTVELLDNGSYTSPEMAFARALEDARVEAQDYVLEEKNSRLAAWEGICNGWSTAAGLVPRPRKSVSFKLPNGKNLKFYPSDIKGIASLYYVNSLIQDSAKIGYDGMPYTQGTVSAGLRCNNKRVKTDIFGRLYDDKDDPFNESSHKIRDSRCSGVHPAIWHLGLVNLIGKQKRSFVVERKVGAAVDNHPMYAYKMEYYNPNTGKSKKTPKKNIVKIDDKDIFKQFRNPKAKYIVGVETEIVYMDYARPSKSETNNEEDDEEVEKKMYYDLELDEKYNIIGGQWRALKHGAPMIDRSGKVTDRQRLNHNQPDFFWTITKGYKNTGWFGDLNLQEWKDKSVLPPKSWLKAAPASHDFKYEMSYQYDNVATCRVQNKNTGKYSRVPCKQVYEKPQPLINVLNALIELSK